MSEIDNRLKAAGWKGSGEQWRSPSGVRFRSSVVRAPQAWDRQQQALLSQAILEARSAATEGERPLAVVVTKRATPLQDERLAAFARRVAPAEAWILCDETGHFFPHIPDEPDLKTSMSPKYEVVARQRATNLFSDTNQWLIKVLLAASIPEHLLDAPRQHARNASMLAELAQVSMPATSRFLVALHDARHLDRTSGGLRISRPLELLKSMSQRTSADAHDVRVAFVHRQSSGEPLEIDYPRVLEEVPVVKGLFDACEALGYGHVKGVPPLLYVQSLSQKVFDVLGVVRAESTGFDLTLRVPRFPRSVFYAAVDTQGVPTTDIIQCWLDASHYRLRGEEQADYLWRKALVPLLGEA